MILIFMIQSLFLSIGIIPLICELSKSFNDSILTITFRFLFFLFTLICGYYAKFLETAPHLYLLMFVAILILVNYTMFKDIFRVWWGNAYNPKEIKNDFKQRR